MEKGDIIRVSIVRRADMGPEHYGIFDGDRGVYHFQGLSPSEARIRWTTLTEFADGGKVHICSFHERNFSRDEVVNRAANKIGSDFGGYNLLKNNCEHFAVWCSSGTRKSIQTGYTNSEDDDRDIVTKYLDYKIDKWTRVSDYCDKQSGSGDYDDDRSSLRRGLEEYTAAGRISKWLRK